MLLSAFGELASFALICSMGPPGANWIMKKFTAMMPIRVGIRRESRLKLYSNIVSPNEFLAFRFYDFLGFLGCG